MPVPYVYNNAGSALTIDPNGIWDEANLVKKQVDVIADRIDGIHNVWKNLKVGWVGDTSDEADAFNEEWNAALTKMFGTKDDPKTGVINQVVVGVMFAAFNYGLTEETVTKMFNDIMNALSNIPGPHPHTAPPDPDPNRDRQYGPIHEVTK